MSVSYKKLWKLLIDKDMNKADLRRASGLLSLNCEIGDIFEIEPMREKEMA